jgi:hypothetical protein
VSTYLHSSQQILAMAKAQKILADGEPATWKSDGGRGRILDANLVAPEAPLASLRLVAKSFDPEKVESYEAALILDGYRIRGIGHNAIRRKHFYKTTIPKGWHQNICDPNKPASEDNLHPALDNFAPTELEHFLQLVCEIWNIDLRREQSLL